MIINDFIEFNNLNGIIKTISNKQIFFIHIPKIGGTTVNHVFKKYDWFFQGGHCSFNKRNLYLKPFICDLGSLNKYFKRRKLTANFQDRGFEKNMLKIAVIRNPIEWLFSIYNHYSFSTFFGLKLYPHKGWGNIVGQFNIKSFEEFVIFYCNENLNDFLVSNQLNPLLNNDHLECDIIIKNKYLNDFIDQYFKIRNIEIKYINKNKSKKSVMHLSPFAKEQVDKKFSVLNDLFYNSSSKFFVKKSTIKY